MLNFYSRLKKLHCIVIFVKNNFCAFCAHENIFITKKLITVFVVVESFCQHITGVTCLLSFLISRRVCVCVSVSVSVSLCMCL